MMTVRAFLENTALLLGFMALLAVFEAALPFVRKDWRTRHVFPNAVLTGATLSMNFVSNVAAVPATAWLNARHFGALSHASFSPLSAILFGVVALDASAYAAHRSMHAIPALWKAHSVHHSDPLVDVTTALRFHPIETAWRFTFVVVPAWLLGLPVEAVAAYRVVSVFTATLEHMNVEVWQPLDTVLSVMIGTPNMHKVHHSRIPTETNTNYGNIFSLFDRLLGTFTPSKYATSVDCGLDGYDGRETQRLSGLLRLPLRPETPRAAPPAARPSPLAAGSSRSSA